MITWPTSHLVTLGSPQVGLRTQHRDHRVDQQLSPSIRELTDSEIKALLDDSYQRATALLSAHRKELGLLAEALLRYETLDAEDVRCIVENKRPPTKQVPPPALSFSCSSNLVLLLLNLGSLTTFSLSSNLLLLLPPYSSLLTPPSLLLPPYTSLLTPPQSPPPPGSVVAGLGRHLQPLPLPAALQAQDTP